MPESDYSGVEVSLDLCSKTDLEIQAWVHGSGPECLSDMHGDNMEEITKEITKMALQGQVMQVKKQKPLWTESTI